MGMCYDGALVMPSIFSTLLLNYVVLIEHI